jgi:hypothetical protein
MLGGRHVASSLARHLQGFLLRAPTDNRTVAEPMPGQYLEAAPSTAKESSYHEGE